MQLKNTKLKVVSYSPSGNPREKVAYMVYGNCSVVFTGLHNGSDGGRGSTTNFAEEIVVAISQNEQIEPRRFTFWDLKTIASDGHNNPDLQPGSFRMDRLNPRWGEDPFRPIGMNWEEGYIDKCTAIDFAEFIWGDTKPGVMRNLAVVYGSLNKRVPVVAIA